MDRGWHHCSGRLNLQCYGTWLAPLPPLCDTTGGSRRIEPVTEIQKKGQILADYAKTFKSAKATIEPKRFDFRVDALGVGMFSRLRDFAGDLLGKLDAGQFHLGTDVVRRDGDVRAWSKSSCRERPQL